MARAKRTPATIEHNDGKVDPLDQQLADMEKHAKVAAQYHVTGDPADYNLAHMMTLVRQDLDLAGDCLIRAGRRLIVMKEYEGHGRFLECLEELGIGVRSGQQMMQIARAFSDGPKKKLPGVMGKSKALELALDMDSKELDKLAKGEEVKGHTLDEFAKMTKRELQVALKSARADLEANNEVIADKQQALDELNRRMHHTKDRTAEKALQENQVAAFKNNITEIRNLINGCLRVRADAIEQFGDEDNLLPGDADQILADEVSDAIHSLSQLALMVGLSMGDSIEQ